MRTILIFACVAASASCASLACAPDAAFVTLPALRGAYHLPALGAAVGKKRGGAGGGLGMVATREGLQPLSRRSMIGGATAAILVVGGLAAPAAASGGKKMTGLSNDELAKAVEKDVVQGQFMVTGELTRGLYDEDCTFQDEIDTYSLDKWIKGTQLLFKNDYSHMDLEGPVKVTDHMVEFRFKERLMFNIPVVPLKCPLTGKLVMTRGKDGLITSYRETWDEPVWKVLLSLRP